MLRLPTFILQRSELFTDSVVEFLPALVSALGFKKFIQLVRDFLFLHGRGDGPLVFEGIDKILFPAQETKQRHNLVPKMGLNVSIVGQLFYTS